MQPTLWINHLCCGLRISKVSFHNRWTTNANFSFPKRCTSLSRIHINYLFRQDKNSKHHQLSLKELWWYARNVYKLWFSNKIPKTKRLSSLNHCMNAHNYSQYVKSAHKNMYLCRHINPLTTSITINYMNPKFFSALQQHFGITQSHYWHENWHYLQGSSSTKPWWIWAHQKICADKKDF